MRWTSCDDTLRVRLKPAFCRFTPARDVTKCHNTPFSVLLDTRDAGEHHVVRTDISGDCGGAISLGGRMQDFGVRRRVVNALTNGSISRIAARRSNVLMILARQDVAALIGSLRRKAFDLLDGASSA